MVCGDSVVARIVVVGSLNMDLVVRAPQIPIPGETVLGRDFGMFPGGKGANQAVAAARQGAQVTFIGRVGADAFGRQLVIGLEAEGIDARHVGVEEGAATGVALITLDAAGENCIVVAPGANHTLMCSHIQEAEAVFRGADVLLLQLETPLASVHMAAQQAKACGVRVVLNPAPAQALPGSLLALVDVLIPNETELALLTGLPVDSLKRIEDAACTLLDQGVGSVVVTLGGRGALTVEQNQPAIHVPAFAVEVVDSTAAGDSFAGAFSVALAEGTSLHTAARRGCAAGALATTRMGAQPSIPTKTEIVQLMAAENR
jgi:ribokinase